MSNAPEPVEAVLFDYGMVLSGPPNPDAWAKMRAITGLDEAALHDAYWHFRNDYDRGALTGLAYWRAVGEHAGTPFDAAQVAALIEADTALWGDLNLPMVEWVQRLQRAGIRTGILSNIGDAIAAGLIAKHPWVRGFDHATWSHALFLAKPDPAIYIATAEALKTPLTNILFLDDREDNIAAAAGLGMQTVRYSTHAEFEREMHARGLDALLYAGLPTGFPDAAIK